MTGDWTRYSHAEKINIINIEQARERMQDERRVLDAYASFYPWQKEFLAATASYKECCLCAANQIGKSFVGATIDAMHLLGDYPDDWKGHRFESAPMVWALGYSMEKTRDLLQSKLFGIFRNGKFSGGLIPAHRIVGHESASGTANAMRSVTVRHATGRDAHIQFWSYSQGQHAIMGDVVDWVHVDEEPRDQTIRPQLLTRTINGDTGKGGRIIYTFTPENGRTDLVIQFMDAPSPDMYFMQKGWIDAPHISNDKAAALLAQYPAHQRAMRSQGIPMLGHGRIYDIDETDIIVPAFAIPDHWALINGLDFGWDHPQACVQLAIDRDNDIVYLTHSWKARHTSAFEAYGSVKSWAANVKTAWPSDGLQHEKGREDSKQQCQHYRDAGFRLTYERATWDRKSTSVEQGVYEIRERMLTGRFKVFDGQHAFLEEMRQYHRDDKGRIVKTMDDVLDAARYAYMMRREAESRSEQIKDKTPSFPAPLRSFGTGARY